MNPQEFSLLNLSTNSQPIDGPFYAGLLGKKPENVYLILSFSLDVEFAIGKRVVNDIVTLFGDIGGFSSFFLFGLSLLLGSLPSKLF